jgi:hypothetical protein
MAVAFSARQQLRLPVYEHADSLRAYLNDERRVVEALLDPTQLEILGPGHYRYHVTRVQLFHLQIQPVVEIQARHHQGRLGREKGCALFLECFCCYLLGCMPLYSGLLI